MSPSVKQPVYVLCGASRYSGNRLPPYGRASSHRGRRDPAAGRAFCGLLWGCGDPDAAFLHCADWAVVRIDDVEAITEVLGAVEFQEGWVVYNGDQRGALETMIVHGADPAAMAVRLVVPGEGGIAEAGRYGVAVAGHYGLARSGTHGVAVAGDGGFAVAGEGGRAGVGDFEGLAVSGGSALAGEASVAVARGGSGSATAGVGGVAVALRNVRAVEAGHQGRAVALGVARSVRIGAEGVAVCLDLREGGDVIQAARDALVILRPGGAAAGSFVVAVAGEGGFVTDRPLVRWAGAWCDPKAVPDLGSAAAEPPRPHEASGDSPPEALPHDLPALARQTPLDPLAWVPGDARFEDVVLLCGIAWDQAARLQSGTIETPDWDAAPGSETGWFGLPWGIGDLRAGRLAGCEEWMVVRAKTAMAVAGGGAVRFASGEILSRGTRRRMIEALLELGGERKSLTHLLAHAAADGLAIVGDDAVAMVEGGGWAMARNDAEAIAGPGGIARVQCQSHAEAAGDGIAISDESGCSKVGARGIALNLGKRYGEAIAGDGGVAVGIGRFKVVRAGDGGAAVQIGYGSVVEAGDGGVAIGHGEQVRAGRNGVAVAMEGWVAGGPGCLLVRRWLDGDKIRYATGIVGEDGIEPYRAYGVLAGVLRRKDDIRDSSAAEFDMPPDLKH